VTSRHAAIVRVAAAATALGAEDAKPNNRRYHDSPG